MVVLCTCCVAEVGLSIIPSVVVDMVNEKMLGRIDYFTVHMDAGLLFRDLSGSAGIKSVFGPGGVPFVLV